jgi:hypothetical protein
MFLTMSFVGESLSLLVLIIVLVLMLAALWSMGSWHLSSPPVWGYVPLGLVAFVALDALVSQGMVVWSALVPALFFIVSLLWVMRSRSMGAPASGLILPAGLYVIVLVGGLITVVGSRGCSHYRLPSQRLSCS